MLAEISIHVNRRLSRRFVFYSPKLAIKGKRGEKKRGVAVNLRADLAVRWLKLVPLCIPLG
jgi:hypothetical protein